MGSDRPLVAGEQLVAGKQLVAGEQLVAGKQLVIDGHQHFWDPADGSGGWMTEDYAAIRRVFSPDDLKPALAAVEAVAGHAGTLSRQKGTAEP
ncbi:MULTISPECIES: hypothetical protein [unclassified Mesorhizobium]|uniref:hypothetical protein n=1 Tax=unclassified Mesorhizobium TaxID=325217 RepID=UPI0008D8FA19|nr:MULTISPECIES: hypothetical protein [unclassified Mesorhizobium]